MSDDAAKRIEEERKRIEEERKRIEEEHRIVYKLSEREMEKIRQLNLNNVSNLT